MRFIKVFLCIRTIGLPGFPSPIQPSFARSSQPLLFQLAFLGQPPCINASSTSDNLHPLIDQFFQHLFEVTEAFWRFLSSFCRGYSVSEEENVYFHLYCSRDQCSCQSQSVPDFLIPIWSAIENHRHSFQPITTNPQSEISID